MRFDYPGTRVPCWPNSDSFLCKWVTCKQMLEWRGERGVRSVPYSPETMHVVGNHPTLVDVARNDLFFWEPLHAFTGGLGRSGKYWEIQLKVYAFPMRWSTDVQPLELGQIDLITKLGYFPMWVSGNWRICTCKVEETSAGLDLCYVKVR